MNKNGIELNAIIQHPDFPAQVTEVLRSELTPALIRRELQSYHENDIAAALDILTRQERSRLYRLLDADRLAEVLSFSECSGDYLEELPMPRRAEILSHMEAAEAMEYLHSVSREQRDTLLALLDDDTRQEVHFLSSFDEDEVGRWMTTNLVSIRSETDVRQAMRELIAQAAENDNIGTIYVVEEDGTLRGAIDLKDLIIAREDTPLDGIIMNSYPFVYATERIDDCIDRLKNYSEDSIPVLDGRNRLKGVLTAQIVTELVGEALSEDYAKLGGLMAEEDLNEPLRKSLRKRLPWLVILLGLGLMVSGVVGLFEQVVARLTLVVCFQSLILDMAGNVGTQSLAVTIRVLMDENLSTRQKLLLVGKEARVGLCNGLILGLLSFLVIGVYLHLLKAQPLQVSFAISLCTGAALTLSMLLSSVTGTAIPLAFKRLHIDPAVASGPLITTVNDLVAVVSYYGLAWWFLLHTLHY